MIWQRKCDIEDTEFQDNKHNFNFSIFPLLTFPQAFQIQNKTQGEYVETHASNARSNFSVHIRAHMCTGSCVWLTCVQECDFFVSWNFAVNLGRTSKGLEDLRCNKESPDESLRRDSASKGLPQKHASADAETRPQLVKDNRGNIWTNVDIFVIYTTRLLGNCN